MLTWFLGHCVTRGTASRVVRCSIGRPWGLKSSTCRRDRQAWSSNVLMHGLAGAMDRGAGLPAIPPVFRIHGQKFVAQWLPGPAEPSWPYRREDRDRYRSHWFLLSLHCGLHVFVVLPKVVLYLYLRFWIWFLALVPKVLAF